MKLIGPAGTELRHILAIYIMCALVTLTFDPLFQKLGHVTQSSCWMYTPIWKFIDVSVFDILDHKLQI